jgi:hypothetical protein
MTAADARRRWIRIPLRELSITEYRSVLRVKGEVKENVLFILRRGCHAGLELL